MNFKKRSGFRLEQLSRMQLYFGEEMVEKYQAGLISWGQMLRSLLLITGSAAAAAAILATTGETAPEPGGMRMPVIKMQPATGPLVVTPDDPTVKGEMVTFQSADTVRGYLARPAVPGIYPGVIVIHEANGLSDNAMDVARRLAKAGYVALAPDLLSRWGINQDIPFEKLMGYLANAQPAQILADLDAAVDYLAQQPDVTDNLGVVGFCFGGGYTLNLAAQNPKIKAAVCYYGVMPMATSLLANTQAAILAHYGGHDERVNSSVPEVEEVLTQHGKTFEKHFYDQAGHGFNNDTVATFFNEPAAVLAWQRTLDWFNRYLKA